MTNAPRPFMDRSRIYRAGIDEQYYQSNLLYQLIQQWSFAARVEGNQTRKYIDACMKAEKFEDQHYYAYFAGVAARRAFSIAQRLLALDEERQKYLDNKPMDWSKL